MVRIKKSITEGPMFWQIFAFAVPLMLTGILQLVYNMADHIIVGRFSGDTTAIAAVGSTASLTTLIINFIVGIAAGASVVIAQFYGAKDEKRVSRSSHTAMTLSVIGGVVFGAIGLAMSEPVLTLMGTKSEVLPGAVLYFRIICLGVPAQSIYNFGAAILGAVGDTKTSLVILTCTGIVNVALNLMFVILCDMSVDGVALATVISQYLSAIAIFAVLVIKRGESYGISLKKYSFDFKIFARMLKLGIPSGIQGSVFSLSNILITAAANTFPTEVVTAKTIAGNIDGVTYMSMNCFLQASMTFTAQNYGANKPNRVKKAYFYSIAQVAIVGIAVGAIELVFMKQLASIFISVSDPNREIIIDYVCQIMIIILSTYFLCGIMDVSQGALRGLGYSVSSMITILVGVCGLRAVWILAIFPLEPFNNIQGLMVCYPATWIPTIIALAIQIVFAWRKNLRFMPSDDSSAANNSEEPIAAEVN